MKRKFPLFVVSFAWIFLFLAAELYFGFVYKDTKTPTIYL